MQEYWADSAPDWIVEEILEALFEEEDE